KLTNLDCLFSFSNHPITTSKMMLQALLNTITCAVYNLCALHIACERLKIKLGVEMEETFNLFHTPGHVILLDAIVHKKLKYNHFHITTEHTHEQIHYNILLHETI
ncbi:hypothetical protein ACJX0J_006766, partial [Zea mays]